MNKKCGYSFWGYLGDIKFTRGGEEASTPDGNAFYSWCIIRELQRRGYEVTQLMPDRDIKGYELMGDNLFNSWCKEERLEAYIEANSIDWWRIIEECRRNKELHQNNVLVLLCCIKRRILNHLELFNDLELILHEYRMLIPGRNDYDSILKKDWQPDYLIQECIFDYCIKSHKRLILFDLDYKLDYGVYRDLRLSGCSVVIFELGTRWQREYADIEKGTEIRKVYIPFDFEHINDIEVRDKCYKPDRLIYVGNRYERDWCIDKYIFEDLECKVYGNWLEKDRDSRLRWPNIDFVHRIQTKDMIDVYGDAICTVLFAKEEYCRYGFMTARILEAVFYGTIPLFIEEYGKDVIEKYAGKYAKFLTVHSDTELCAKINVIQDCNNQIIKEVLQYLREHLKFMDVKNFVDIIEEVK